MTTALQSIPLNKLVLSNRNVRKTGAEDAIDDLVASIAAHGLLQSLVVQPGKRGKFAVIAGGRRLRALQTLLERGDIETSHDVPCRIIGTDEAAEELSLAENIIRAPMHPADQFEAFRAVIDQGKTIADVAACFNVSEDLVERRLKLGRLSPVVLQAYRDEKLDLEDAQAFALSDNHAEQERVFSELTEANQLYPRRIRAALTHGEVPSSDRRVRFVGRETYLAAGGMIRRDLFDDEDDFYINDEALLEKLVAVRLSEMADAVKAEGWQWVKVDLQADYATYAAFERHEPEVAPLSKKASRKIDALSTEYDALVESMADEPSEADLAKLDDLQSQIDAMQPAETWPAETMAMSGAIVSLDASGQPTAERGLMSRTEARKQHAESNDNQPAPSPYSAALVQSLTAHKTAAIRIELARSPNVALAALVHALALDVWYGRGHCSSSCLDLHLRTRLLPIAEDTSKAVDQLAVLRDAWQQRLPEDRDQLWAWCLSQSRETHLELLAFLVAQSVDAVREKSHAGHPGHLSHGDQLATALRIDMRNWFVPTVDSFLNRISRKTILASIDEATGSHGPALAKLGKKELALRAEQLIAPTGWLPEPLRVQSEAPPLAMAAE